MSANKTIFAMIAMATFAKPMDVIIDDAIIALQQYKVNRDEPPIQEIIMFMHKVTQQGQSFQEVMRSIDKDTANIDILETYSKKLDID